MGMETWTVEIIERDLLPGETSIIARPESEAAEAVGQAQRLLGDDWVASLTRNQKGLVPAMRIVGIGLRLRTRGSPLRLIHSLRSTLQAVGSTGDVATRFFRKSGGHPKSALSPITSDSSTNPPRRSSQRESQQAHWLSGSTLP